MKLVAARFPINKILGDIGILLPPRTEDIYAAFGEPHQVSDDLEQYLVRAELWWFVYGNTVFHLEYLADDQRLSIYASRTMPLREAIESLSLEACQVLWEPTEDEKLKLRGGRR